MTYDSGLLQRRLHGIVASRVAAYAEEVNAVRAAHPNPSSARGHGMGKAARAQCYGALERVLFSYLNYCKSVVTDPATHIDLPKGEINWLRDELINKCPSADQALAKSYLDQFLIDAAVSYEQAATGRWNDELLYSHAPWYRRAAASWFTMTGAAIGWLLALVQLVRALIGNDAGQ